MSSTSSSSRATFADTRETYQAALQSIFTGSPSSTEVDLLKIFHPELTIRDNHSTKTFPEFVEHIRWVREVTGGNIGTIECVQWLKDGNQVAERHRAGTEEEKRRMTEAGAKISETLMFVTLAEDGRMIEVVELVNPPPRQKGDQ